jgi:hypothetical protein
MDYPGKAGCGSEIATSPLTSYLRKLLKQCDFFSVWPRAVMRVLRLHVCFRPGADVLG